MNYKINLLILVLISACTPEIRRVYVSVPTATPPKMAGNFVKIYPKKDFICTTPVCDFLQISKQTAQDIQTRIYADKLYIERLETAIESTRN